MIYFDKNKNAFSNKINNYIASVDNETWHKHSINSYGSTWDIINGEFIDLTTTQEYKDEKFQNAKNIKLAENLNKAKYYEQNGTVEYKNCVFEMSDSNRKNLSDTQEALILSGQTQTQWNDKNDEIVTLTVEDIQKVRLELILEAIKVLWLVKYLKYKKQIDEATTLMELEAIKIDYMDV